MGEVVIVDKGSLTDKRYYLATEEYCEMTVKEFLEKIEQSPRPDLALDFMMNLLTLLDEFDSEACSVLAGKIRAQLDQQH